MTLINIIGNLRGCYTSSIFYYLMSPSVRLIIFGYISYAFGIIFNLFCYICIHEFWYLVCMCFIWLLTSTINFGLYFERICACSWKFTRIHNMRVMSVVCTNRKFVANFCAIVSLCILLWTLHDLKNHLHLELPLWLSLSVHPSKALPQLDSYPPEIREAILYAYNTSYQQLETIK